jgi:oligosaccharide repeat unit polymerase
MKFQDLNKIDIFSPYIIVFGVLLYILLALPAFYYQIKGLKSPSIEVYLYFLFGTIFFLAGVLFPKILEKLNWNTLKNFNLNTEKNVKERLFTRFNFTKLELILLSVVILGIILQSLNLYNSGGIPLLSAYLKAKAVTKIWIISYLLFLPGINILLAKYNRKAYYLLFILGIALFAFTGYRTTTIVIILSVFITLYFTRNLKLAYFIIFVICLGAVGLIVGYVAVKAIPWQQWTLNPLELFFYRAGYTLTVFDQLLLKQGATHGTLMYYTVTGFFQAADPRAIVGEAVLGYHHSTTSTLFGPALLDFGAWALAIQMFFMGLVIQVMYMLQKLRKGIYTAFYAIILAQTLVWIETGPTDLVVWIFYLISVILIIHAFFTSETATKKEFIDKTVNNRKFRKI